jgi:hypothetical protein
MQNAKAKQLRCQAPKESAFGLRIGTFFTKSSIDDRSPLIENSKRNQYPLEQKAVGEPIRYTTHAYNSKVAGNIEESRLYEALQPHASRVHNPRLVCHSRLRAFVPS